MTSNECLILKIIDINRIQRTQVEITTVNKECHVISCRLSGSSCFNTRDGVLYAEKGDILFVPKGASYSQFTEKEDVVFIHLEIFGESEKSIKLIKQCDADKICHVFTEMQRLWKEKAENYAYLCTGLLYSLVGQTGTALSETVESGTLISPALKYIDENFCSSDLSLDRACSLCGISRVYFNRLFRKEKGVTPIEYINLLRIKNAEFLLKCGSYTHREIAEMCGYSDIKYFYTVFKKITGCTTKQFLQK